MVGLVGIGLFTLYIMNIKNKLAGFNSQDLKQQLNLPSLGEELNKIPKIELPNLNGAR